MCVCVCLCLCRYIALILNFAALCLGLVQAVNYFIDPNAKRDILLTIIGIFLVGLANCLWLLLYGKKKIIPSIVGSVVYILFAMVGLILYGLVT